MNRSLVKRSPPPEIAELFADPAILSNESRAEYDRTFAAIASAVQPADGIAWLLVRDITDLSWEIQRERRLKSRLLRSAELDIVATRLAPPPPSEPLILLPFATPDPEAAKASRRAAMKWRKKAESWTNNPSARDKINREIEQNDYESSDIPMLALQRSAAAIDAIDRRIAGYEARRMMALKMIEHYDEALARRLERSSTDVIEGQYAETAAE
jgi:hypothetical protein